MSFVSRAYGQSIVYHTVVTRGNGTPIPITESASVVPGFPGYNGSETQHVYATITYPSQPATNPVSVLVFSYAEDEWDAPGNCNVSDGMSDPATAIHPNAGSLSEGYNLIQVQAIENASGQWVATTPTISQTAQGSSGSFVIVGFSCTPDTRSVEIVYPTFYKSPQLQTNGSPVLDAWGNPLYAPKERLPSGTNVDQGDVGIASQTATGGNTSTGVTFAATRSGNWTTAYSTDNWTESLLGQSQTNVLLPILGLDASIPDFTATFANIVPPYTVITAYDLDGDPIYMPAGPGNTGTDTIKLKYTDGGSGSAVATATYTLTVHNPVENLYAYRPATTAPVTLPATFNAPGFATAGSDISDTYSTNPGDLNGGIGQWTYNVLFPALPGWVQSILTALSLSPTSYEGTSYAGNTGFWGLWNQPASDTTWTDASGNVTSTPPPGANVQAAEGEWKLVPTEECLYTTSYLRGDSYVPPGDPSGYVGFAGQTTETSLSVAGAPFGSGGFMYYNGSQQGG